MPRFKLPKRKKQKSDPGSPHPLRYIPQIF